MNEADTCRKFAVPKLQAAGWDESPHAINEQRTFTDGRIVFVGDRARICMKSSTERLSLHDSTRRPDPNRQGCRSGPHRPDPVGLRSGRRGRGRDSHQALVRLRSGCGEPRPRGNRCLPGRRSGIAGAQTLDRRDTTGDHSNGGRRPGCRQAAPQLPCRVRLHPHARVLSLDHRPASGRRDAPHGIRRSTAAGGTTASGRPGAAGPRRQTSGRTGSTRTAPSRG